MSSVLSICFIILLVSCMENKTLNMCKIQNTKWLFFDFGDCQNIYSFEDSTFKYNNCEILESFHGSMWIEGDTVFLLIPEPKKKKIVVGGDSVEIYEERYHSARPTLKKLLYKNDTLFFYEVIDKYQKENHRKYTNFQTEYLTRYTE